MNALRMLLFFSIGLAIATLLGIISDEKQPAKLRVAVAAGIIAFAAIALGYFGTQP